MGESRPEASVKRAKINPLAKRRGEREAHLEATERLREKLGNPHTDAVRKALARQLQAAVAAYTAGEAWEKAARDAEQGLTRALSGLYRSGIMGFAEVTYEAILDTPRKKDGSEIVSWVTSVANYISRVALRRVTLVSDATIAITRAVIQRGLTEGLGVQEIARHIRRDIGEINDRTRAERIVRTEMIGASNQGAIEGARSTGLPMEKTWLATGGPRTRVTHAAASGQSVPLDGTFLVGGASLEYPGDPNGPPEEVINCRCATTFEVIE